MANTPRLLDAGARRPMAAVASPPVHDDLRAEGIGDFAQRLESNRFIGRRDIIDPVLAALRSDPHVRVFHLSGVGGVGKSATLRAIGREASDAGAVVRCLDGRLIAEAPDSLQSSFRETCKDPSPDLILLDEADALLYLRFELRRVVADELPASTVIVIAGRAAPAPVWFEGGLDLVSKPLVIRPLDARESRALLESAGMSDPADLDAAVAWSQGYPLALTLVADLGSRGFDHARAGGATVSADEHLDDLLLGRLGTDELAGVDPDVLDVAALAAVVDARMLSAVLPGRSTKAGLTSLRACRLSEPIGARVTLHRLVRQALRTRLRESDPDRYRTLILRIADHLRSRAELDPGRNIMELAALIENEQVRLSFDPSSTHYADRVRPGDLDALAVATGCSDEGWFQRLATWIREQPGAVVTVRSIAGSLSSVAVVFTSSTVPSWALDHIEVGPVLDYARKTGHIDEAVFLQDVTIIESPLTSAAAGEIVRVGNAAALVRSGMPSPRYAYVTSPRDEIAPLESVGYVEVPELRRNDADRALSTIVCDFGPDGMVGKAYDIIRFEQRDLLPERSAGAKLVTAIRCYHDDEALSAVLDAPADRARQLIAEALERAFPSPSDERLRLAIERTYLDAQGGHGVAQRELIMSRSSFYRHLQAARRQLAERGPVPPEQPDYT
ncbi:MAG: ATP-binding protein [Acidimicrobiales bacterium]|nr:ATP-binding protein [Acidimicrobiales bacterium]